LIDFAVFLLITASFWSECYRTTSSRSMVNSVFSTNSHFPYMVGPIQVFFLAKVCFSYNRGIRSRKF
jgi:hypothetical protein